MAAAWIVEAVDILEYRPFCLAACVPAVAPDQLCLDGFEEGEAGQDDSPVDCWPGRKTAALS